MLQVSLCVFLFMFGIFAGIMIYEPRSLWSGISFLWMMIWLAVFLFFVLAEWSDRLAAHEGVIWILSLLFVLTVCCMLIFPAALIIVFFVEGIKVIRHEGMKASNLLSALFSVLLCGYLAVWPRIGHLNSWGTALYAVISFAAVYILALMAMYSFSAMLNLVHLKKARNADYIIVLGCGIIGSRVTPLLAARIEKGIELLHCNPNAILLLSGGQGPGEDMPESQAMAEYAAGKGVAREKIVMEQKSVSTQENLRFSRELIDRQNAEIVIVTTAYHVFRALILAKQEGIKCVGFGSKTKWYFTLNAFLREFAGYMKMTWKKHAWVIGAAAAIIIAIRFHI